MAGLAIAFLLLATIFMNQDRKEYESQKEAIRKQAELVHTVEAENSAAELVSHLKKVLSADWAAKAQQKQTEVQIDLQLHFPEDHQVCVAVQDQVDVAAKVIDEVLKEVCRKPEEQDDHAQIFFEGHTDNAAFANDVRPCGVVIPGDCKAAFQGHAPWSEACCRELFETNVRLSAARAEEAFFRIQKKISLENIECLKRVMVISGRGPLDPINHDYGPDQNCHAGARSIDSVPANRRVIAKVVFAHAVVESKK